MLSHGRRFSTMVKRSPRTDIEVFRVDMEADGGGDLEEEKVGAFRGVKFFGLIKRLVRIWR